MCSSSFNISNQIFVRKWEQRQFRQSREYFFLSALLPPKHLCTQKTGQETNLFNKPNRSSVYIWYIWDTTTYIYMYIRDYIYIYSLFGLGHCVVVSSGEDFLHWGVGMEHSRILCTMHYFLCTLQATMHAGRNLEVHHVQIHVQSCSQWYYIFFWRFRQLKRYKREI